MLMPQGTAWLDARRLLRLVVNLPICRAANLASKLPRCQDAKLPSCRYTKIQAAKSPSCQMCQAAEMPSCRAAELLPSKYSLTLFETNLSARGRSYPVFGLPHRCFCCCRSLFAAPMACGINKRGQCQLLQIPYSVLTIYTVQCRTMPLFVLLLLLIVEKHTKLPR